MTPKLWLIAALSLLTGLVISFYLNSVSDTEEISHLHLDDISVPDLTGNTQSFQQWQGKLVLVNFWATWCPPCREEIPLFLSLRKKYSAAGFEIVGISIDEVSKVMQYRDAMHIDYPLLNGQQQGMSLMASLGNRTGGLPYSVIFDRNGNVIDLKSGAYKQQELVKLIENHL
jgi:thiol-disulfide isomerase/thioredoxin